VDNTKRKLYGESVDENNRKGCMQINPAYTKIILNNMLTGQLQVYTHPD